MISVQLIKIRKNARTYRDCLVALAPSGAILARRYLATSLTSTELAERVRQWTAHWTSQVYQPIPLTTSIIVRCEDVLL